MWSCLLDKREVRDMRKSGRAPIGKVFDIKEVDLFEDLDQETENRK